MKTNFKPSNFIHFSLIKLFNLALVLIFYITSFSFYCNLFSLHSVPSTPLHSLHVCTHRTVPNISNTQYLQTAHTQVATHTYIYICFLNAISFFFLYFFRVLHILHSFFNIFDIVLHLINTNLACQLRYSIRR